MKLRAEPRPGGAAPQIGPSAPRREPNDARRGRLSGGRRRPRGDVLARQDRLRTPRRLILLVALLVIAAGAWMALAEVERVVRASGRLIPSDRAQIVQHLEGGIVAEIMVREGQIVERDAELLSIADVQAQSQVGERKVRLLALRAQVARLRAEAMGATEVEATATERDTADFRREILVFEARRERIDQSERVLREQLGQRQQELREAESRSAGLRREFAIASAQLSVIATMIAREAASRMELLDAQSRAERLNTQVKEIEAAIPKIAGAIRELEGKIAELGANFRAEARTRLAELEVEARRLEEEINASTDRLARTAVRSPSRGVVNRIYTTTIGGVVRPGDAVVEITPLGDRLTIEASIAPQDRAEITLGLPAIVRVSAYDYATHGTLDGHVAEVSADTLADDKGNRYYRVRIDIDPTSFQRFGRELVPGMTVTADVVIGERTVLQYVFSPLLRFLGGALRDRK
jgi:adhesin transport system membrane fusion protein